MFANVINDLKASIDFPHVYTGDRTQEELATLIKEKAGTLHDALTKAGGMILGSD